MKIVMAATEMSPLASVGGLGEVLAALPARLQAAGHEVSVILPFYRQIRENRALDLKPTGVRLEIALHPRTVEAAVLEWESPEGVQVFFIRRDEYFDRTGLYGANGSGSYDDNAERFIFFSKAVVQLARHLDPAPHLLHLHDWPTALVPALVEAERLPFSTLLSIHDPSFEGICGPEHFPLTGLSPDWFTPEHFEYHGLMNLLKGGVSAANCIVLKGALAAGRIGREKPIFQPHCHRLRGITPGLPEPEWNREPGKLTGAALATRRTLFRQHRFAEDATDPVILADGGEAALVPQLDRLMAGGFRLVLIDAHAPSREWQTAERLYPRQIARREAWDASLLPAVDALFLPGEPQEHRLIDALRAGVVPVARAVPGLDALLTDAALPGGNALLYYQSTPDALADTFRRLRSLWHQREAWKALTARVAESDFSWDGAAARYDALYRSI